MQGTIFTNAHALISLLKYGAETQQILTPPKPNYSRAMNKILYPGYKLPNPLLPLMK